MVASFLFQSVLHSMWWSPKRDLFIAIFFNCCIHDISFLLLKYRSWNFIHLEKSVVFLRTEFLILPTFLPVWGIRCCIRTTCCWRCDLDPECTASGNTLSLYHNPPPPLLCVCCARGTLSLTNLLPFRCCKLLDLNQLIILTCTRETQKHWIAITL